MAIELDKRKKSKFKPKGREYLTIGYANISKVDRLYDVSK